MALALAACSGAELESRIEAFESAWRGGRAVLADFLPDPDSPSFRETLCELVRVDLELRWTNGQPRSLDAYLNDYPELRDDPKTLGQLAFEEFRQCVQAGVDANSSKYAEKYGIEVDSWPRGSGDADSPPTRAIGADEMVGTRNVPAPFPRVGENWHGFQLIDELGRGSFGRVFLAKQGALSDRSVALKISTDLTGEPEKMARLLHTNIMPIYSAHRQCPFQAFCMPYLGSTTLAHIVKGMRQGRDRLPTSGRMLVSTLFGRSRTVASGLPASAVVGASQRSALSGSDEWTRPDSGKLAARSLADLERLAKMNHVEAILWIVARVTDGLAHAHDRGLLHRDLKPANILLTDDGQPLLLDFNLATNLTAQPGQGKPRQGGTFPYMAPEQLEATRGGTRPADCRSDLYALGLVLFELLTGRHPFEQPTGKIGEVVAKMLAQRSRGAVDPRRLNPAIPASVASIVGKLLAPLPQNRYQSARDLLDDLERQQSHRPLKHAPNTSPAERLGNYRKRYPRLTTAAAVALAASILLVMPVGLLAVRRAEDARHRQQLQSAQAKLLRQRTLVETAHARLGLSSRQEDPTFRNSGMSRVEQVAATYGAGADANWLDGPRFAGLDDGERKDLLADFGETFLVMAGTVDQQARDRHDPAMQGQAAHWNELAEQCFDKLGRVPSRLYRQREAIQNRTRVQPAAEPPTEAELAKLDDADLFALASDHNSEGRHVLCLQLVDALTRRTPDHFMGWYLKGMTHSSMNDQARAAIALTVCIALKPEFHWPHYYRGLQKFALGEFRDAVADFSRALELEPRESSALAYRGEAHWRLGDLGAAERDLTAALTRDGAPMRAWFVRAEVRSKLGREPEAKADYDQGMKIEPSDEVAWTTRGFYRLTREPQAALDDFDRALALNPRYLAALSNKHHVLSNKLGRRDEAENFLNEIRQLFPDYAPARASHGVLMARRGSVAEAIREAEYCLARDCSPARQYQIGSLFAQLAKYDSRYKARSLELLAISLRSGLPNPEWFASDRDLDPIRDDREFVRLSRIAAELCAPARNTQ